MKAAIVRDFGPIETLAVGEMPAPVAGPGEVLVEIHAAAVNFVDLLVITGKYQFLPDRPFTPGKGPAGKVIAVGRDVAELAAGDRVLAMAEQGGYGELVAVAADQCFRLPAAMSYVDAASMSLAFDTAWFALRERARVRPGEVVLVLGATGGVGQAATQLAKAMGARVLAGVSGPGKGDAALAAGADAIIDLSAPDLRNSLREQVHAETNGGGADIVLDMLGGDYFDAAIRAVAWRGRVVIIGFAAGRIPTLKVNYLMLKNIEVSGLQVSDYRKRTPDLVRDCFAEIFALFEAGKLRPPPASTLPLEGVVSALQQVRDRTAPGRVILVPTP